MSRRNELADAVQALARALFKDMDGEKPTSIYDMVLKNIEKPMIETVLGHAEGNQSLAARCSASTATRCARRCSSCGSRGSGDALVAKSRGRCSASPTSRASSSSPAAWPPPASRSSPPAAPRSCSRKRRRRRSPRSRRTPASRRCSTAASRRCTRRSTAACSRGATTPRTCAALAPAGIEPIDLLVVNLYPFQATVADPGLPLEDAIENIDIGGPAMLRAAAKNHAGVAVRGRPRRLPDGARRNSQQRRRRPTRRASRSPRKSFAHTAAYDGAIANYLRRSTPRRASFPGHAHACSSPSCRTCATARTRTRAPRSIATRSPAAGSLAALPPAAGQGALLQQHRRRRRRVGMREELRPSRRASSSSTPIPAASRSARRCWKPTRKAFATDPTSAFGGIIAFNRALDRATAEAVGQAVRRSDHRAAGRSRRAEGLRSQGQCARARGAARARRAGATTSSASAAACWCRARDAQRFERAPTSRW